MTERSRWAEYRDRKRGGPPRPLQPCGTVSAYKRHRRRGEPVDAACAQAWADWQRNYYKNRKQTS